MLTYEEITSVDTLDALTELYAQKGHSIDQVKNDWPVEVKRVSDEAQSSPPPQELPYLEERVDGACCRIYGVRHDFINMFGGRYKRLVFETVKSRPNWLYEQQMGEAFSRQNKAVEVPDYAAYPRSEACRDFFFMGLLFPFMAFSLFGYDFNPARAAEHNMRELNLPLDASGRVPYYVIIGQCEKKRHYPGMQRRSAYQAEFMRAWKPTEDRNILAGRGHVSEIKYFLKYGAKDPKVVSLARTHAKILEEDPERFKRILHWHTATLTLTAAPVAMLGASPWFGLAYAGLKLLR